MINILVDDIVPIIVIMALGYICGKFSYFDDDQRQGLNKLVLNIALPAALFVSIIKSTRAMLAKDATLTAISFIGVIVMFMVSYYLCRLLFHRSIQEAAVCALIAGSPTIGFLGFAVLDPIYGNTVSTNLVIAIISIVVNVVTIPIGMYLINLGQAKDRAKLSVQAENAVNAKGDITLDPARDAATDKTAELMVHGTSNTGKNRNGNLQALLDALKPGGADLRSDRQSEFRCGRAFRGPRAFHGEILARLGNHLEHVLPPDSDACGVPWRGAVVWHGR